KTRNAANFGVGLAIRPRGQTFIIDVVVAAQPFVRTESLMLHESQRRLIDISARNVPPRREAGLIQDYRSLTLGDNAVLVPNKEITRSRANVARVIAIGSMA